ncbi:type 4a pilus biogenesis protein PilO [Candidatus Microgenomates bacterium]|nr:type 4a pilus biogenesis protein PilO [Candidatus Microgenomates bacterium]
MKPQRLNLILVIVTIALGLAGLVGYWLLQGQLSNRVATLSKITSDLALEYDQTQRLQKLEAQYANIEPLAIKAQGVLPVQKEQAEVVAQISAIVKSNGLSINGLTFEQTKGLPSEQSQTLPGKISGVLIMPVRFQTAGSYAQLQSLLRSIERQQRFMRVSTLELSRDEDGLLTANFTLELYFKP